MAAIINEMPRLPRRNVVVIDTTVLSDYLSRELLENDPLVARLAHLLMSGDGFDATRLIFEVIQTQARANKELLDRCIKLSMYAPMTLPSGLPSVSP